MKNMQNKYCYVIAAVVLCLVVAPFMIEATNESSRKLIVSEGGIVETSTVVGYFACFLYLLYKGKLSCLKNFWYIHSIFILFALREMDFHKKFTTMGIFKSKFYISESVPLTEKFFASLVLVLLFYIVYLLTKNHYKNYLVELKAGNLFAVSIFISIALVFISKSIDGFSRKLSDIGITISSNSDRFAASVEEVFEFGIPVMFLIAMLIYFNESSSNKYGR